MNKQGTVPSAILAILGLVVVLLYAVRYLVGKAVVFLGILLIMAGLVTFKRAMVKHTQVQASAT